MDNLLKRVKNIYQEGCVSIIFNTHRTKPDSFQDPIRMKNLVKEAEERLRTEFDDDKVEATLANIQEISERIDHQFNLESLVIFANTDFCDFTRLPIAVENRVVVDDTFATRDLVRALHLESAYYVLTLSQNKSRLIEAFNDKLVKEVGGEFPLENQVYTTNPAQLTDSERLDNLLKEFYNRVDKCVQDVMEDRALPIVVASDRRNFDHYHEITDRKELVVGFTNGSRDDTPAHKIVSDAWEEVRAMIQERNKKRLEELNEAVGHGRVLTEYNDIWAAISEGRGQTLFVQKDLFQPALLATDDNTIMLLDTIDRDEPGAVDDIIDEMIERNRQFGGDTVFVDSGKLAEFQGIALITRY